MNHEAFLQRAIDLAVESVKSGTGGPFGAVIVKDGQIIAEGKNNVTTSNDPTAHAEVTAIRLACETLGDYQLNDCILYTSCEPCPMCLGAIYWARPKEVYFAAQHSDAASAGFDDSFIYEEITKTKSERTIPFYKMDLQAKLEPFLTWETTDQKVEY
ncbi:nucleoside deaminase [Bacillus haynesii]|uniref:nucleoside deaminase n=1 Tax=Bacillus haynesii TaxID=1925021 RepID=UPI001594803B|nr:nucleoside deaminase [Bacillus haynesii]NVB33709.1 nucleoside deaminase [Bacillus licheniformis]MCY7816086.1 nucleoside deaminase [Bacillus haynesii]MCY8223030.1 nucleoside deaminase [Bacillus haynesii]MCY8242118.1 nucleoside deaminase [Bacillus haynesii]MCY8369609.1 nucleoside deaminase [Bacillus haynesii]